VFTKQAYPAGDYPNGVAIADLNGDGIPDVVAADYYAPLSTGTWSSTVAVLLGTGGGALAPAVLYDTGTNSNAVAIGDLDGDGKLDLAVSAFLDRSVRILRGAGDGSFGAPHVTRIGDGPVSMAAGDLDRDGRLDLVVAERVGVAALLGNGDGSFRRSVVAAGSPAFVALADVNADGKLDLVWSDWFAATVTVYLGNGDGTFTAKPSFAAGDTGPGGIAVGDLNGDGKADLVVTTDSGASVFLGNGDGTFVAGAPVALLAVMGPAAVSVALVDVDLDGKLDLVAGGFDLYVARGNGDGTFQAATAKGVYTVNGLLVADVNGDGAPDVAAACPTVYSGPKVSVFPNQAGVLGYSVSTPGPADPSAIAAGDLDGDGKLDVAVTGGLSGDLLEVLLGRGDLTFPRTETLHVGDGAVDVVLGDFDGDGRLDAAVLSRFDDSVRILPNRCP
jgi:FG-GAP-like repeat